MADMKLSHIQLGDWVSGTSKNDERYRGFVEAISREQGSALIRVTESDREATIGRVVESSLSKLEGLPDDGWKNDQAIHDLIDLALATRDDQWFMELTSCLLDFHAQKGKTVSAVQFPAKLPLHRRIWIE
jgi:hypothetical protein